jgi:hypothetical protein
MQKPTYTAGILLLRPLSYKGNGSTHASDLCPAVCRPHSVDAGLIHVQIFLSSPLRIFASIIGPARGTGPLTVHAVRAVFENDTLQ